MSTREDDPHLLRPFSTIRAFGRSVGENGSLLAVVLRGDGAFGLRDPSRLADAHALAGVVKCAAQEWPHVTCKVVDVAADMDIDDSVADRIVDELSSGGPLEVGLSNQSRVSLCLKDTDWSARASTGFGPDDVIVVSGGARGVTGSCVIELARTTQATFVLLGRSPMPENEPDWLAPLSDPTEIRRALLAHRFDAKPSPRELEKAFHAVTAAREIRDVLRSVREHGSRVWIRAVDVRDHDALCDIFEEVRTELGPIRAVVHGAGVLEDGNIVDKTDAQITRVVGTKLDGARALLSATRNDPLKALVFFSSVAARFGNAGQSDYALANEGLNKMARVEAQRRPDCRVVSVNWGPWDGGMVTPALRRAFEARGVPVLPVDVGVVRFVEQLMQPPGAPVEVVIGAPLAASASATRTDKATPDTWLVSRKTVTVLDAHRVRGRAVLPVALMVDEMARRAQDANTTAARAVRVDDFRLFRGTSLVGDDACSIRAEVVRSDGDDARATVSLVDSEKGTPIARAGVFGVSRPRFSKVPKIRGKAPFSPQDIYDSILFHGDALCGIVSVDAFDPEVGLRVTARRAPEPSQWRPGCGFPQWTVDPLVLDVALQLGLIWTHFHHDVLGLPSRIARFTQIHDNDDAPVSIALVARESTPQRLIADVFVSTSSGRVIAHGRGVEWTVHPELTAQSAMSGGAATGAARG